MQQYKSELGLTGYFKKRVEKFKTDIGK